MRNRNRHSALAAIMVVLRVHNCGCKKKKKNCSDFHNFVRLVDSQSSTIGLCQIWLQVGKETCRIFLEPHYIFVTY